MKSIFRIEIIIKNWRQFTGDAKHSLYHKPVRVQGT